MYTQFHLTTTDNLELYGQCWKPEGDPRAVLCIVHGMGEHGGRYEQYAKFCTERRIAVITMDHRGHGKSKGKRGHAPGYDQLMNDVDMLRKHAEHVFPGKPLFLFGQSMGGNLVLNYGIRKKPRIKGIIASSPYLRLAFQPPTWKLLLAKVSGGLLPGLVQPTGLDTKAISRDPEVVSRYENDALVHDKISVGFFNNVHYAGPYAIEHAGELAIRTLIMHGTGDKITSFEGSREFAEKAHANVELKLWEGMFHELHNEPEKDSVMSYTLDWLKATLG